MSLSSNPTFQRQERELILNRRIEELSFLYQSRQTAIVAQLQAIWLSPHERKDLEIELRRIRKEIKFLNQLASAWAEEAIPEAYRNAQAIAAGIIVAAGVVRAVDADAPAHQAAINNLVRQTKIDLLNANRAMLTGAERIIRQSQLSLIQDQFLTRIIDEGALAGLGIETISGQVEKALVSNLGQGKMLSLGGRNWQPGVYARMLSRTRLIETASHATINTSLQYGVELVQVSFHQHIDRPGDRCPEFAGNIYSITGTSREFPQLTLVPPFHPNCRHVLVPVVDPTIRG